VLCAKYVTTSKITAVDSREKLTSISFSLNNGRFLLMKLHQSSKSAGSKEEIPFRSPVSGSHVAQLLGRALKVPGLTCARPFENVQVAFF
jgi:hypothetical protein